MNPKFSRNDFVYYKDNIFQTTGNFHLSMHGFLYEITQDWVHFTQVDQFDLLTPLEWEARQKRGQNYVGRMVYDLTFEGKIVKENLCTCGAHAVKDSRHSSWCDIKN